MGQVLEQEWSIVRESQQSHRSQQSHCLVAAGVSSNVMVDTQWFSSQKTVPVVLSIKKVHRQEEQGSLVNLEIIRSFHDAMVKDRKTVANGKDGFCC